MKKRFLNIVNPDYKMYGNLIDFNNGSFNFLEDILN